MEIAIDASRLSGQRLGVGRYLEYMFSYFSELLGADERVVGYTRGPVDVTQLKLSPSVRIRPVGPKLTGLTWQNVSLPLAARDADVLFAPAYIAPLGPRPRRLVVATHSVNEASSSSHPWWYRHTYGRVHRLSAKAANAVIVPCEQTKDLVIEHYGVRADRIAIVEQGTDETFRAIEDEAVLSATRRRYFGQDVPYVLFVGKLSQRRNIPNLIRGFARAKKAKGLPHKLLLLGPNHLGLPLEEICRPEGVENDVVRDDGKFANHQDLIPVYSAADLFVHPSEFEGWSMTTVEALACGRATIVSNTAGLREVVKDAALLADDIGPDGLAERIGEALTNRDLHADLQARARARGAQLTWRDTFEQTLDVIRRVAAD